MNSGVIFILACAFFLSGIGLLARYLVDNKERLLEWANSEDHS